jgi:hypothetical protein
VIDAPTQALLQDVLRRDSLSLLQYIRDAFPWTRLEEQGAWPALRQVVEEDAHGLAELAQFLARRRVPLPYIGTFPVDFTSINFVSLDFVLPRLLDEQRREVAALEADLARVSDPEAREQLQRLLDMKRRHLPALEGLAAAHPEPAVR